MNRQVMSWFLLFGFLACSPMALAQGKTQSKSAPPSASKSGASDPHKTNIQAYIELLRKDVRQQKSQLMGAVMLLDAEDATKFWPIYSEYDAELTKINDLRRDNIQEYARTYTTMTDEKADELIKNAMDYQRQRTELLGKYYERMKQELGAITAARFVQIEHQLLMIIDLQIASSLPIVGQQ